MLLVAFGGSLIVGCALGMIFRVLILIPATLVLIVIVLLNATWSTVEVMLVAWVGVQIGYLGGTAARWRVVESGIGRSGPAILKDQLHR
jgi:hypothetical protein